MPTRFEFPLSYMESMMPHAATTTETVSAPMPQESAPGSTEALQELLASLENPTVPQPQQPRQYQRVLGALGDALNSMASVRAGGGPVAVGPFQANLRAKQAQYEKQSREAQGYGVETRNKVRIGAFEESQRAQRELAVAKERASKQRAMQLKQFRTTDASGRPVMIPYNYNPNFGTLAPAQGYEQGFEQYVKPFLAQGINTETGEMEFRLLDPFSGSGIGQQGGGAPQGGGGVGDMSWDQPALDEPSRQRGGTIPGFEPKPSAGEIESADAGVVIRDQMGLFKELARSYKGGERTLGSVRAGGQGLVRAIPLVGKPLSETLGDPDYEELSALRGRIGQQLARLVENGRLSDQDRDFALENLPTIESLTTESGRRTAAAKIAIVEREIATRLSRKKRLRPGLMSGPGSAPPAESDPARDLFRQMFGRDPEEAP